MSSKQKLGCAIGAVIVIYTAILLACGIYGAAAVPVGVFILKWILVLFGYFMAAFLPIRIMQALAENRRRLTIAALEMESKEKQQKDLLEKMKEKALQDRIEQEYLKSEDDI